MSEEFIQSRELTSDEESLLRYLLRKGGSGLERWALGRQFRAIAMPDGGMGGIKLININTHKDSQKFGSVASEIQFADADGTPVSAALLLDQDGEPFELDIFKADFTQLLAFPKTMNEGGGESMGADFSN